MSSINRKMANLITSTGDVASSALDNAASMSVFSSVDSLPYTGISAGDQALVGQRLYVSNGSGWYSVALINASPTLTLSPTGTIILSTDGSTSSTITVTTTDSDDNDANIILTIESDGDFFKMATVSQDSSIFTITPRSEDSATALGFDGTATLTFKASDGVAFATEAKQFNLTFSIQNSSFTTVLLQADASATKNQVDASGSAHSFTEHANVESHSHTPYHPGGYSVHFDGSGDQIKVDNVAMAGNCTFEFWFYQDITQSNAYRCMLAASTYASGVPFTIYTYGSNVQVWLSSGGTSEISGAFTAYTWHHMAMVRNSGTWTLYIDGVAKGTSTTGGSYDFANTTDYHFGENAAGSYDWKGYIRDARFVSGTAVYTSAFSSPEAPLTAISGTELLLFHAPYIRDGSSPSNVITAIGNPKIVRIGPYDLLAGYTKADHGGSVFLNASPITTGSHADFGFGTGDWTVEFWSFTQSDTTQNNNYIVDIGSNGLVFRIIGDKLTYVNLTDGVNDLYNTGATIIKDTWNHLAVCRISNTTKMYLNGIETASGSDNFNSPAAAVSIGQYGGGSYTYKGFLSDLRIVKGTGVYTSNFTPPTVPLTAISGTKLLTLTNKNDIWDAAAHHTGLLGNSGLTKSGNVVASNTQRKFTGSSSIYYPGTYGRTVQYLDARIGTGDFTIEGWVWFNAVNVADGVFHLRAGALANDTNGLAVGIQNNGALRCYFNNSQLTSTTIASAQTWIHFAAVRNNGSATFYVNGTATSIANVSDTNDYQLTHLHTGVYYGTWPANYDLTGYIQDFRLTTGLARYTYAASPFTPPTALFTG